MFYLFWLWDGLSGLLLVISAQMAGLEMETAWLAKWWRMTQGPLKNHDQAE